ncbi:MAG: hypothetical protein HFG20_01650 [Anaerotruncus sp.]|jgi:hypothetical protein|nr:hypothetical protein [Anaerotruncus sp.]
MSFISFPTSKDIYIEIDGVKVAVAQSYKSKTSRESRYVEAFGSAEPVGTVGGRVKYLIELTRVMLCGSGSDVNFHDASDFNLVVMYPNHKIIYSGCQWASIDESVSLSDLLYETVSIVATSRMEVAL